MARCEGCIHFDVCYLSEIDDDIRDNGENPDCVHYVPTADVAPRAEIAAQIFADIREKGKFDEQIVPYICLSLDELEEIEKKYTEE